MNDFEKLIDIFEKAKFDIAIDNKNISIISNSTGLPILFEFNTKGKLKKVWN